MSRFKTIFFWLFVLVALAAGIFAYFNLKNSKKPQLNALSVLPDSCLVYLNSNDFFELNKKINSQSLIADKMNLFPEVNFLLTTIQEFDSLFNNHEDVKKELTENLLHFASYKSGFLFCFNLKQLGEQQKIDTYLMEIFQALKTKEGFCRFRTRTNKVLYYQLKDGVVVLSDTPELILSALDSKRQKLIQNLNFSNYKGALTENNLLSIYVNHTLFSNQKSKSPLNLNAAFQRGYSVGSIDFKPSEFIANGYIETDSSEIINFLFQQETQSSKDLAKILPANTVHFQSYALSDYKSLSSKFKLTASVFDFWELCNKKALYNLKFEFETNVGNHLLQFKTQSSKSDLICLAIEDEVEAQEHLTVMSDTSYQVDSIQIFRLELANKGDNLMLFEPLLNGANSFATLYDSHIYFSNSKENLVQCLNDLKSEQLLSHNQSFIAYMNQQFTDEYNLLFYNSPNLIREKIPTLINLRTNSETDPFQNFKHFSFSLTKSSNQFKFRFHLLHESENKSLDENVLWTLKLDTVAIISPEGFVNHLTGENELLVQDANNALYLINAKGTILWKKKLSEKIASKVFTVDIYKNNKYQLLFNTLSAIHLIDRNGAYVENYPVDLPAEASNEINVFDYDGDKDYRILVACKNNLIYNFNIHGIKQEKFSIVKTDNKVSLPIQYVKIGLSDYLVAIDSEGKIYTFSRKGVGRIGLRNRSITNCKAFYCDLNNSINNSYIIYLDDKSGHINKISFDDRKEIIKLDVETEDAEVKFRLIDDNRSMDLLLTKDQSIWSYNFSGNLISENKAEAKLNNSDFYKDESHEFYYALSEDQDEIILQDMLNQKTLKWKGTLMPLISNLFKDNQKYLIISNKAQMSCVKIN